MTTLWSSARRLSGDVMTTQWSSAHHLTEAVSVWHQTQKRLTQGLPCSARSCYNIRQSLKDYGVDVLCEQVCNARCHDTHCGGGDARVRVNLLQDLVDVRRVRFGPAATLSEARGLRREAH